jgi:UDP-N-acetylglucosamine acyltransferase
MNTGQAVAKLKEEGIASEDVAYLVEFIESSERGVLK